MMNYENRSVYSKANEEAKGRELAQPLKREALGIIFTTEKEKVLYEEQENLQ